MLLLEWLERESVSFADMGERIGRSGEAVRRYAKGLRIPDREAMAAIVNATDGEVTANDFFGIPSSLSTLSSSGPGASQSTGQACETSTRMAAGAR